MSYQELQLVLESSLAEEISDLLMDYGALSSAIEDAHAGTDLEQPIFGEPGEPSATVWMESLVLVLFPNDIDVDKVLKEMASELNIPLPKYKITQLPEQDWVRLTQAQFDPIKISSRLWIVPTWHEAPDSNAINLQLDPGLAFGTGSHPTTKLCLQWLDENLQQGNTVLDYGCGSGILAIAALKLGAAEAIGVDIDPQAIIASKDNAQKNTVAAHFFLPDEMTKERQFDVLVANILSNPLRMMGKLLAQYVKVGGKIVLSGILEEQADELNKIYSTWFTMAEPVVSDGWVCLSGIKQ